LPWSLTCPIFVVFTHSDDGTQLAPTKNDADGTVNTLKEDSAVEKQKPFGEKDKQGQQHKPGQEHAGPSKEPKDEAKTLPGRPGERSDEESIGRPVQLDKDEEKPRRPEEGRPRKAGV
jgi:hypothetical protein